MWECGGVGVWGCGDVGRRGVGVWGKECGGMGMWGRRVNHQDIFIKHYIELAIPLLSVLIIIGCKVYIQQTVGCSCLVMVTTEHNEGSMYYVSICLSNITLYLQEVRVTLLH